MALKEIYKDRVVESLQNEFNYRNCHEIPKLVKINVNRGLGMDAANKSSLQSTVDEFRVITGQQPVVRLAKKSIAGFKIREGMPLGVCVTLRNEYMYSFLERLIKIVLPRVRDFRGLDPMAFDGRGNYNLGLTEQLIFPEINYEKIDKTRGFNITIVTTAKTNEEGYVLLKELGFPFAKKDN